MQLHNSVCVIPAVNTTDINGKAINYVNLAAIAATRVRRHLGLPVYLLTNTPIESNAFDGVIVTEENEPHLRTMIAGERTVTYHWGNDVRVDSYETLSQFNQVLMIDADYFVSSPNLKIWIDSDRPFCMYSRAIDITGRKTYEEKNYLGTGIKQRWATAMLWRRSATAQAVFTAAQMVRDNYEFYALMLGMPIRPFRNDVAFSVACHLNQIPDDSQLTLFNLPADARIRDVKKYEKKDEVWFTYPGTFLAGWDSDIHLINKEIMYETEILKKFI